MISINNTKNRNRDAYSFANINLLGKCNVNCFFCLGKDIEKELSCQNQMGDHYLQWKNFPQFLTLCNENDINKIYLTGQNTDPLLYPSLKDLILYIQNPFFGPRFACGIRTNGYLALEKMDLINSCKEEIGYSVHTLNPITSKMILGRSDIPDWEKIFSLTESPMRVSIVINRCNVGEFFDILDFLSKFPKIRYVQVRRISTDTREKLLSYDIKLYEDLYTKVHEVFSPTKKIYGDADVFNIYGKEVVFWRTIKTNANSLNYFTDGTISDQYFIVEGYLKNKGK